MSHSGAQKQARSGKNADAPARPRIASTIDANATALVNPIDTRAPAKTSSNIAIGISVKKNAVFTGIAKSSPAAPGRSRSQSPRFGG